MTNIVLGASAGVGRELARELAARGKDVLLIARDGQTLDRERIHLRLVYGITATVLQADATRLEEFSRTLTQALERIDVVEALFCPLGASSVSDDGHLPRVDTQALIDTNFQAIAVTISLVLPIMLKAGAGHIVGFSSIAAARGRNANVIYSASKRALESYFESLRHGLVGTDVKASMHRLGYVATQQTYGKQLLFPIVSADTVARHVLDRLDNSDGQMTYPRFWMAITCLLRLVPWSIYQRLRF